MRRTDERHMYPNNLHCVTCGKIISDRYVESEVGVQCEKCGGVHLECVHCGRVRPIDSWYCLECGSKYIPSMRTFKPITTTPLSHEPDPDLVAYEQEMKEQNRKWLEDFNARHDKIAKDIERQSYDGLVVMALLALALVFACTGLPGLGVGFFIALIIYGFYAANRRS